MTYRTCSDAYAQGVADIPRTHPSYAARLDRDNDGVACEVKDAPGGFKPRTDTASTPAVTTPAPTKAPTAAGTKQQVSEQLPVTGPATVATVAGGLLLAVGGVCVVVARRRRRAHR